VTRPLLLLALLALLSGCARREPPPRPEPVLLACHGPVVEDPQAESRKLGAAAAEACFFTGVDHGRVFGNRIEFWCRKERSLGVVKVAAPLTVAESGAGSGEGAP